MHIFDVSCGAGSHSSPISSKESPGCSRMETALATINKLVQKIIQAQKIIDSAPKQKLEILDERLK